MRVIDDRTKALAAAGLFKTVDLVIFVALLLGGVVTFFDWLFSPRFTTATLVVWGLVSGLILLIWTVLLGYRCCVLIIEARADINLMPEAAARIARLQQIGAPVAPREKP